LATERECSAAKYFEDHIDFQAVYTNFVAYYELETKRDEYD
jgi:hypothetical protein